MNIKRILIYILSLALFIVAVAFKISDLSAKKKAEINTIGKIHLIKGVPVSVKLVEFSEIKKSIFFTLQNNEGALEGFITNKQKQEIQNAEKFSLLNNATELNNKDFIVNESVDTDKGLYKVSVAKILGLLDERYVVKVDINTGIKGMLLPNNIVEKEDQKYFVWTVKANQATKKEIVPLEVSPDGTVINENSGLKEQDILIVRGQTLLKDGSLLNIKEED